MEQPVTYYTAEQVAEMTGMSRDWIWKQCKQKRIPHHRFGGDGRPTYRFTLDDLKALERQTATVPVVVLDDELTPTGRGSRT